MSISSDAAATSGNVPRLGQEKNVTVKIKKNSSVNQPQSAKVDHGLAERQSLKAKPMVESRKSVASLVNANKSSVGNKIDIKA